MNKKNTIKIIAALLSLFFIVTAVSLTAYVYNNFLPAGSDISIGDYNQKQIEKIQQKQSDKFSFAVLSDSHINPETGSNSGTLKKILKDIDGSNYSFAIDIGDLVVGSAKQAPPFFYDVIKREKTPFLVAVGNHDLANDGGKYYLDTFGSFYYSFSYGNSLFIVANDATGAVDKNQMLWLEEQLKKNYQHKFVFMHIPFNDPRQGVNHDLSAFLNGGSKAKEIADLMEKYKPDIVFFGHIHAYYDWVENGVEYITTGGAGGNPVGEDPKHDFHNYIEVQVDGNNIVKQVKPL